MKTKKPKESIAKRKLKRRRSRIVNRESEKKYPRNNDVSEAAKFAYGAEGAYGGSRNGEYEPQKMDIDQGTGDTVLEDENYADRFPDLVVPIMDGKKDDKEKEDDTSVNRYRTSAVGRVR